MLYTYYGDDFTGSTDVLEQLASAGVEAVLFLRPPTMEDLARFPSAQAIGLAGDSRSRSPAWMSQHLPELYRRLAALGAPVLHYKTCSTFDSSPVMGSIGRAMELAVEALHPRFVPIVVGAPHLRRYVVDANLFAAGPDGEVRRIDQHPMSRHPVTPMREPNLIRHLAQQTALPVAHLREAEDAPSLAPPGIALFDVRDERELEAAGRRIWREASGHPVFAVGSSGLTAALVSAWRREKLIVTPQQLPRAQRSVPLLVVSGSCSPATEQQIRWALQHGFHGVALAPPALRQKGGAAFNAALGEVERALLRGQATVLYTALGAPDAVHAGEWLGCELGRMVARLLERTPVERVVFCGGDTSSHAVQQLGLTALSWAANLQPGAPLCRAHGDGAARRLELVLKGGQVGSEDFFALARDGREGSSGDAVADC